MSLTSNELSALGLPDAAVERVLLLHEESLASLTQERDAWREAAAQLDAVTRERDELTQQLAAMRVSLEEEQRLRAEEAAQREARDTAQREAEMRRAAEEALLARGANPKAAPLLARCLPPDALSAGDAPGDMDALLDALNAQYPDFFQPPRTVGTPQISPPAAPQPTLTAQDLQRMSEEEINRNWQTVKQALRAAR